MLATAASRSILCVDNDSVVARSVAEILAACETIGANPRARLFFCASTARTDDRKRAIR